MKILLAYVVVTLATVYGQDTSCPTNPVESTGTWTSPNYPAPYPGDSDVSCTLEYAKTTCNGLYITVDDLDVNGQVSDYLLLKTGDAPPEANDEGRIFTWHNAARRRKYLFQSDKVFMKFRGTDSDAKHKGFHVTYECNEDVVTTTVPPPTTIDPYPELPPNNTITVYVQKVTAQIIMGALNRFEAMLVSMARTYCSAEGIATDLNPKAMVELVRQCSYAWPDYANCVEIRFAVAVAPTTVEAVPAYQLNRTHLEIMWDSMSQTYLDKLGLQEYSEPDENAEYIVWITVIVIVLVGVLGYLYVLSFYGEKCTLGGLRKRRLSDTQNIIETQQRNFTELAIGQHSLQTMPPLFDSEFTTYEPDMGIPPTSYAAYSESDASEDEEILSVQRTAVFFDNPNVESDL